MPQPVASREALLKYPQALCDAFAQQAPLEQVLQNFSSCQPDEIQLFEHGLSQLAPFLGKSFRGLAGARDYFTLIANLLSYENMSFSDFMVDVQTREVSVRGEADFIWKSTANRWHEVFVYRLKLDQEGRILVYEVWADSGAAYLASRGELAAKSS